MRTRSNFYPFNSSTTIPRRSKRRRIQHIVEPEFRAIENIVPMADRTMEELLQAPTEGYGEAIVIPEILAENFEIKTNLLQLVQANKIHGRENDNPHTHISNFKIMIATLKYRDVPNDAIKLMLFPYSLEDRARIWLNTNSRDVVCKTDDRIDKLADQISNLVEIVNKQVVAPAKAVEKVCVTCGGAHAYYECIATDSNPSSVSAANGSYNQVSPPNRVSHQIPPLGFASAQNNPNRFNQNQGQGNYFNQANNFNQGNNYRENNFQNNQVPNNQIPPSELSSYIKSNEIAIKTMQSQINVLRSDFRKQEENLRKNLNDDMKTILSSFFQNQPSTSGTLPSNTIPNPKGEMKDVTTRSGLAYEGPSIPTESPLEKVDEQNTEEILDQEHSNSSGSTAQVQPPVVPILIPEPVVLRTWSKPSIPYTSSFADALLLMPKFASTIKSLLANKDKLFELAKVPLNENFSAMLLKKLPEKLGDPGKFLIPCDFPGLEVCHALADLGASINLMPLSIWRKLLLPELTPTRMTLELADSRSKSTFNLREVLLENRSCFNRCIWRRNYPQDVTCEDFVQDVLDFKYNPNSSIPTLVSDDLNSENESCKVPIVKSSSLTLTLFGESDFSLDEIEEFFNDDSIATGIENLVYDSDGDILFFEKLLNEDPCSLLQMDLKLAEESKEKSFVEEPPKLELKELPSHLEYAFLEDSNKLPVIIAKNLKVNEREALLNVLKSHKRVIAWKISDIKGIDPRFCTHKILMEDDYKPAVQSQRRVNPKIHDVIKKEVIKLFDAGMIYPISDSPWVSPIHCVPKKEDISKFLLIHKTKKKLLSHALMEPSRTVACPLACVMLQDFSKISRLMTHLLEKETRFVFSKECIDAFNTLKKKLREAPILVVPDWNLPFELMCDASDYVIGAVLGQRKSKHFQPVHYASKTMTEAQIHYTMTEKEMIAVVYAFEKFWPYLVLSKSIVYTDHSALKYLLNKQDAKPRKLLKFSKLATRDLPGDIMVSISQRRRGREKYLREMRCPRTISKFVRYSIFK
nr:hypothetical protein [Tanacetum cinerariifolium]